MTDHRRLTTDDYAALGDAHLSVNHGGLSEATSGKRGTVFVGNHPDCHTEHRAHVVSSLAERGFLQIIGQPPLRSAHITEVGMMERECAVDHSEIEDAQRAQLLMELHGTPVDRRGDVARRLVIAGGWTLQEPSGGSWHVGEYCLTMAGITGMGATLDQCVQNWMDSARRYMDATGGAAA